jgi:hypothetical protein
MLFSRHLRQRGETMTPKRIQRKRTKGWRMPEGAVCVDRSTGFGNPFPVAKGWASKGGEEVAVWAVGTFEGPAMWFTDTKGEATKLAVDAYRAWLHKPAQRRLRDKAVLALRGKDLACWCPLEQPCHADVLLELANADDDGPTT